MNIKQVTDSKEVDQRLAALMTNAGAVQAVVAAVEGTLGPKGLDTMLVDRFGTITVTNVGVFGVDAGVPILNPGEAAILAVGAVQRRPWELEGQIALRDLVVLSLAFDHRLLDGQAASLFLAAVGEILADPVNLVALG